MNGKIVAGGLVAVTAIAGVAMYWLQVHAFYEPASFTPGAEIRLTPIESGAPEAILVDGIEGIDGTSSPLRFRACFRTPLTQAMLSETYMAYEGATPTVAPGWFGCFDAQAIGAALERGEALAFLSEAGIAPKIDRVVAVFPDGRAFAWHQVSPQAEE